MGIYNASDLVKYSEEAIWKLDNGNNQVIEVKFHDGVVKAPVRRFIYDWYFWEFHRQIKGLPLSKRHHISDRPMDKATDNEVINKILRDIYYLTGELSFPKEKAAKITNKVINSLYRITDTHIEEYFTMADISDVITLMRNPEIVEVVQQTKPDRFSINTMYEKIRYIISNSDDKEIVTNPVVIAARMGVVPVNQILQLITVRGYVTEINSCIYINPTMFNYTTGNYSPIERLKDARSGTKSLASTKTPLELSEYQGRRLRLVAMYVKGIIAGDCGSKHYIKFEVTKENIKHIDGVWCLGSDGKEFVAWADSEELIGTVVEMRNPLTCLHKEHVCERCYGLLHLSVPANTNIGWACAVQFSEGISQGTLSLKHLDFNAIAKLLYRTLTGSEVGYLYSDENNPLLWKIDAKKANKVTLIIPKSGKGDIAYDALQNIELKDVKDLRHVLQTTEVIIYEPNNIGIDEYFTESVGTKSNQSTITKTFLKYMRWRGFEVSEKGEIRVNLDKWNPDYPIMAQEFKAENNLDVTYLLGWVYEGRGDGGNAFNNDFASEKSAELDYNTAVKNTPNPSVALTTLYNSVSYKIPLHVSVMGVMLKAVRSISTNHKAGLNYNMASGDSAFHIADLKSALKNRSFGGALAFEDLKAIISDPATFQREYVDDHPFDVFLTGKQ